MKHIRIYESFANESGHWDGIGNWVEDKPQADKNNYHKIMKKSSIELVEISEVDNVMYCVLHTYKINILKKLWKKWRASRIQI